MIDDIFAFRDNFVSQFAKIFENEGWVTRFHKDEAYWNFKLLLGEVEVSTHLSGRDVRQVARKPQLKLSAGLSKRELDIISNKIMPPAKGFDPQPLTLASLSIEEEIPIAEVECEAFIRGHSRTLVRWAEMQDVEPRITNFAKPWQTEMQITHLAALAYVGDFNKLMDYHEMLKRGKRANLYPYIKRDMLDRAADIALERA